MGVRVSGMGVVVLLAGCGQPGGGTIESGLGGGGAAFTTFDQTRGGCENSTNGVNCNIYDAKEDVYLDGGPDKMALPDGSYFFAVIAPGTQNGGFLDGAKGNLSDTFAGGTAGDNGSGDPMANRTFAMVGGSLVYGGTHALGTAPDTHTVIQLMPYDDTPNPGGVYILAICRADALSPRDCKFDAFKVKPPAPPSDGGGGSSDGGGPGPGTDGGCPPDDPPPPGGVATLHTPLR